MACLRVSISGLVLLPFFLREFKKVEKKDLKYLIVVGLAGSAIPAISYGFAQTHIPSSVAGMLNSLTPLFTLLIGILFFAFKTHLRNIFGVAVGLVGAIFLVTQASQGPVVTNAAYALLIAFASICYATSGNVVARYLSHLKSFTISIISYGIFIPITLAILFTTDFIHRLQTEPQIIYSITAVTILAVFGTALASILYFTLVQRTTPLFASMVTYLIPVIAVILGFFDGETLTVLHGIGLLMIFSGIYLSRF